MWDLIDTPLGISLTMAFMALMVIFVFSEHSAIIDKPRVKKFRRKAYKAGYKSAKAMHKDGVSLEVIWIGAFSAGPFDQGQRDYCKRKGYSNENIPHNNT